MASLDSSTQFAMVNGVLSVKINGINFNYDVFKSVCCGILVELGISPVSQGWHGTTLWGAPTGLLCVPWQCCLRHLLADSASEQTVGILRDRALVQQGMWSAVKYVGCREICGHPTQIVGHP